MSTALASTSFWGRVAPVSPSRALVASIRIQVIAEGLLSLLHVYEHARDGVLRHLDGATVLEFLLRVALGVCDGRELPALTGGDLHRRLGLLALAEAERPAALCSFSEDAVAGSITAYVRA